MSQPPYSGPPYGEQPPPGPPHPGQSPYQGQPYPGQPYPEQPAGQPYPGQPHPGQPYPAQPYPGQPNPDVPTSVPPGYPPTQAFPSGADFAPPQYGDQAQYGPGQYEQAQYGAPQYGDQGYAAPGFPPVPPKKKSKALPIVLVSVAVVLVLCVGGGVAIFLAVKTKVDKTRDSLTTSPTTGATGEPTSSASAGSSGGTKGATISVVEPKTLGGRPKVESTELKPALDLMKLGISDGISPTKTVGAAYGKIHTRDIVLMTAAQGKVDDPAGTVDQQLAAGGSTKITGVVAAPTGDLGGSAKCGTASAPTQKFAICFWADEGSVGAVIFYFKTASTAKAQLPAARAQIEQKS